VTALADDPMVAESIDEALAAGVPEGVVERIVAEEAALLDGTPRAFELSASIAAGRLGNAAKARQPGRRPVPPRMDVGAGDVA
jgi:hypothetical protein